MPSMRIIARNEQQLIPLNSLAINKPVALGLRSNWNLEIIVFAEGGKPEYPEKNPRSKDENH